MSPVSPHLSIATLKDVVAMLDWFAHNETFPFPNPLQVIYDADAPTVKCEATISFGGLFTIKFEDVRPMHDLLRCDINGAAYIRVLRMIRTAIIDGRFGVLSDCPPSLMHALMEFAMSKDKVI